MGCLTCKLRKVSSEQTPPGGPSLLSRNAPLSTVPAPSSRLLTPCPDAQVKCNEQRVPCETCKRLQLDCTFAPFEPSALDHPHTRLGAPTESLTEAGTVRRRATVACRECRARKAKCSGQRPQCHRCAVRSLSCVYASGHRHSSLGSNQRKSRSPVSLAAAETHHDSCTSQGSPSINTERLFLTRDVIGRHVEAYFEYVYHLPGYDFFHRPSLLEDFHNDNIPPVLSLAICAAVSMYVASSREGRQLSIQWSRDLDRHIFANLSSVCLLNLQIIILSIFQHYAYRQMGRAWLMHGLATRLALSHQLNKPKPSNPGNLSIVSRECARRLIWGLYIHDKIHSGGVEEFVALPSRWMLISLPATETDFQNEIENHTETVSNGTTGLVSHDLGIGGYLVLLHNIRYEIISSTKAVISRKTPISSIEISETLATLRDLQKQLKSFHDGLPPYLRLSDRNTFSHSTTPSLTAYISLHTWYFQTSCDLFRICLPGMTRESASPSIMQDLPNDFVISWRRLCVSFAITMATTWARLLELKHSGVLHPPGNLLHLSPESCVSIHQCTKILLIARNYEIYSGLVDPLSNRTIHLSNDTVDQLCQSNISFIDDLTSIAPIAAVVQQDVKEMVRVAATDVYICKTPATSHVQRDRILSRYHPLAVGIAARNEPGGLGHWQSCSSVAAADESHRSAVQPDLGTLATVERAYQWEPVVDQQQHLPLDPSKTGNHEIEYDTALWVPVGDLFTEYSVPPSHYDMEGELDLFLTNIPIHQP